MLVTPANSKDGTATTTTVTLDGDFQTATVTLTATTDTKDTTVTTDDVFEIAALTFDSENAAATTELTLVGNGTATVTNGADTALVTVDASALNSLTIAGKAASGLNYSSDNAEAETITLGAGIDAVELNASTYGAEDTVIGLNLVLNTTKDGLAATSDTITGSFGGNEFEEFVSTQTDLDLVLTSAAQSADDYLVFEFDGDTYIFVDEGTAGTLDAEDTVVKLAGVIDLDTLVIALA